MVRIRCITLFVFAVLLAFASDVRGQSFDAASLFDPNRNPAAIGGWSYGFSSSLGGAFSLYSTHFVGGGSLEFWTGGNIAEPLVVHNPNGSTAYHLWGTSVLPANQLALHPGRNGEYSILRWTAPAAGTYSFSTLFTGLDDSGGTTTDVHVLKNAVSLFNDNINGYLDSSQFSGLLSLANGDIIDFAVGFGTNNNYLFDTTGLSVGISAVPESGHLVSGGLAIAICLLFCSLGRRPRVTRTRCIGGKS